MKYTILLAFLINFASANSELNKYLDNKDLQYQIIKDIENKRIIIDLLSDENRIVIFSKDENETYQKSFDENIYLCNNKNISYSNEEIKIKDNKLTIICSAPNIDDGYYLEFYNFKNFSKLNTQLKSIEKRYMNIDDDTINSRYIFTPKKDIPSLNSFTDENFVNIYLENKNKNFEDINDMKENFRKEFIPIKEKVLEEGKQFSFSKVSKKLKKLFPQAEEIGDKSKELFDLYAIYSLVLSKKEEYSEETIKITKDIFHKFKGSSLLTNKERYRFHYRLYKSHNYLGNLNKAIKHLVSYIKYVKNIQSIDKETILAQKEELAYMYHENRQYKKALNTNLEVKKEAVEIDIDEKKFLHLYNNIAQNYYELDKVKQTEHYLNKVLITSRKYKDIDFELHAMFQLAVLAYEQNNIQKAKKYFEKRLELAKEYSLTIEKIERIKKDLNTFNKRRK